MFLTWAVAGRAVWGGTKVAHCEISSASIHRDVRQAGRGSARGNFEQHLRQPMFLLDLGMSQRALPLRGL